MDANGNISVGTKINLKKVTFGDSELTNVRASVVRNQKASCCSDSDTQNQSFCPHDTSTVPISALPIHCPLFKVQFSHHSTLFVVRHPLDGRTSRHFAALSDTAVFVHSFVNEMTGARQMYNQVCATGYFRIASAAHTSLNRLRIHTGSLKMGCSAKFDVHRVLASPFHHARCGAT